MNHAATAAFVGREQELERFRTCFERARAGTPTLLLFEGEPGSGKSRLLDAIAESPLLRKPVQFARVPLDEADSVDPVSYGADNLTHQRWLARFGGRRRAATFVRKVLPDWLGAIPVIGDLLEAVFVTGQAIEKRRHKEPTDAKLTEDIEELHRRARRHTVVLILDDLQFLTEASADRLLRLVKAAKAGTRLLLVGAARTPRPGAGRQPFRVLLDRLPADRIAHDRLDTLTYPSLHAWMAASYPDQPLPPGVVGFLLAETGGQPGAVLALLERLLDSGALSQTESGWVFDQESGDEQLESAVGPVVEIGQLRPEIAETVTVASIFGDEFDTILLGQLLQIDELELEDRLAAAVRGGVVAVAGEWTLPNGDISTRYRFVSSAARAALHRSLPAARRAELESRMLTPS